MYTIIHITYFQTHHIACDVFENMALLPFYLKKQWHFSKILPNTI